MRSTRRPRLRPGLLLLWLLLPVSAPGKTLSISTTPPGASLKIDGLTAGTTPYHTDYPSGYFHKPHTSFGSRLTHAMVARISMEGYLTQEITLTSGPFDWVAMNGRHRGHYFLLKSSHFEVRLEAVSSGNGSAPETIDGEGPMRPPSNFEFQEKTEAAQERLGTVTINSDPPSADIYVDGEFAGETPSTIRLKSGSHHIAVKSRGRKSWERDLDVFQDSRITLNPILQASP